MRYSRQEDGGAGRRRRITGHTRVVPASSSNQPKKQKNKHCRENCRRQILFPSHLGPLAVKYSQTICYVFRSDGVAYNPIFPILGVFRLKGQPKRDGSIIFRSCKATQSPVYPIRDAFLAVNHASCSSLSSSAPRQWGESALKTSRLPGALSLLAKSWLYPPSAWRLTCLGLQ